MASIQLFDEDSSGFDVAAVDERIRRNAEALGFALVPLPAG
jgi:hypothetical protein